jgi:hypothetical protein
MLDPIFAFFEKLISDFSWRRLAFVLLFCGAILGGLWMYEGYTGTFRLGRVDRELALLERLTALAEKDVVRKDQQLLVIFNGVKAKLADSSNPSSSTVQIPEGMKKALAAAFVWVLLALTVSLSGFNLKAIAGMVVVATPFVILAAFIPSFEASWINYWLYPIGHVSVIMVAILLWQRSRQRTVPERSSGPA